MWMPLDIVQKYMREKTFPSWDGVYVALSTPRFKYIMDYMAILPAVASALASAFWWFSHSLRAQLVMRSALHCMSPWQHVLLQNAQPQPQRVDEALFGARQGEETETGVPIELRQKQ